MPTLLKIAVRIIQTLNILKLSQFTKLRITNYELRILMSYPAAPWPLQGFALLTLQLVECDRVRPYLPAELDIVSILPNLTIGGIYVSSYQSGSVLEYNELIVVAGLVRYRGQIGSWISHIYVDHIDSVAGGRDIWGLPKQLATFTWEKTQLPSVRVEQNGRLLCVVRSEGQFPLWQQRLVAPTLSHLNAEILQFWSHATARLGMVRARVTVPPASPFVNLGLDQPWFGVALESLQLQVDAPTVVGQVAAIM